MTLLDSWSSWGESLRKISYLALGALAGVALIQITRKSPWKLKKRKENSPEPEIAASNGRPPSRRTRRRRNVEFNEEMNDIINTSPLDPVPEDDVHDGSNIFGITETLPLMEKMYAEESRGLLDLLYNIAEDQAKKEGFIHRSITCNHCGTSPVRGNRFKCANCQDFDLCETCEAADVHEKSHVFLKIKIPIPPLANPRTSLVPLFYPGKYHDSIHVESQILELQKQTHFDQVELDAFMEQFKSLSSIPGPDGGITKTTFDSCLGPIGSERNLIKERIFKFFDQDKDEIISFNEFVRGMSILCKGSFDERVECAFKGYDLDEDGYISRDELQKMFKAYFNLSMELVRDVVKTMEEGLIESFDDEAAKPVSSAFQAPIPASNDNDEDEENKQHSKGKQSDGDYSGSILLDGFRLNSRRSTPVAHNPGTPSLGFGSRTFKRPFGISMHAPAQASPSSLVAADSPHVSPQLHRVPSAASYTPFKQFEEFLGSPTLSVGTPLFFPTDSPEQYPIMEEMSQDAIKEMVERTFIVLNKQDENKLSFEDFKTLVEKDSNLLAWFEALGSVF